MVAVRRKLAFSRTVIIPKDNRYEHGPAQRTESANTDQRGGSAKHGATRGLIYMVSPAIWHAEFSLCTRKGDDPDERNCVL